MSLWHDPRDERCEPIWNPVTQRLNYPWFTNGGADIEWLPADVWMYRHRNREQFGRSPYVSPSSSPEQHDDAGYDAEAADVDVTGSAEQAASDDAAGSINPDSAADQPAAVVGDMTGAEVEQRDAGHDAGGAEAADAYMDTGSAAEQAANDDSTADQPAKVADIVGDATGSGAPEPEDSAELRAWQSSARRASASLQSRWELDSQAEQRDTGHGAGSADDAADVDTAGRTEEAANDVDELITNASVSSGGLNHG